MENKKIIYYEQLDSTNTRLQEMAFRGAEHGTVVVAKEQTAGKGRRGRNWESKDEGNIYMSMLLRPEIPVSNAPMLTLVMAYSVALVLKKQGFDQVKIKWPNDLILSNKKVCGILTEMFLKENQVDYVVIGVGVNVNVTEFSHELVDKATSLYMESGETMDIEPMIEDIVEVFHDQYKKFLEAGDLSFLQAEYNQLLINQGREVVIVEKDQEYHAHALGMNEKGELIVRTANGETQEIYAGEVSVRGVYGYV